MTFDQILQARKTINSHAHLTPVMTSRTLDGIAGAHVFLKCENLQRVGAFKFRGAFNAISNLTEQEKARGILTYSSGNHAQAVALASKILGVQATIVMPGNAPLIKRKATKGYGAKVIEYDPEKATREAIADDMVQKTGATLVPPFDHENVIAGQGTATAELFEQAGNLDVLMTPVGGGGLLSGSAIAAKHLNPNCTVIGIEPETADDAVRSFHTKTLQTMSNPQTIADGTRTPSLGKLTFPLILKNADDMKTVTEDAIKKAVRFLFSTMKIVVEPSGAIPIAALLTGVVKPKGRVGIIVSGGNIDRETMAMILNEGD